MFHVGGITFSVAAINAAPRSSTPGSSAPSHPRPYPTSSQDVALAAFETIWLPVLDRPDWPERDLHRIRLVMAVGVPERLRAMAARVPQAIQVSCLAMTESSSFLALSRLTTRSSRGSLPAATRCPAWNAGRRPGHRRRPAARHPGRAAVPGPNGFAGYLRDPEATAAGSTRGLVAHRRRRHHRSDGRVTFRSRLKDMLKVGGENVSAAEMESHLLPHPAVGMVEVVAAPDERYVEVPAAFIQLKPGDVTEQEIIDFCAGKIATFRVPRYVRFVTEWPMSGTKIKKAVLREMIAADLKDKGITRAPKISTAP